MGVFFVNSQQDADMLKRSNRKIDVQNLGTVSRKSGHHLDVSCLLFQLSIMVSRASCPVPSLDEDTRLHFKVRLSSISSSIFQRIQSRIFYVVIVSIHKHF